MDRDEGRHQDESEALLIPASGAALPASPAPREMDEYLGYLEAVDLTEAQKRALLQTLWEIMCDCARLGFGLDPIQQLFGPALAEEFSAHAESETKQEDR
jgi:hypothetical protein